MSLTISTHDRDVGLTQGSFKRLSLIVRVNVVLNRTVVVVDSDLCGSHLQSQSELYHVS